MQLTVRRKLQLLLLGSLTAALVLVAGALRWLVDYQGRMQDRQNAHVLLSDIGMRIADLRKRLASDALAAGIAHPETRLRRDGPLLMIEAYNADSKPERDKPQAASMNQFPFVLPLDDFVGQARSRNLSLGFLFSGHFDTANPLALKPADLANVPSLVDMDSKHSESDTLPNVDHLLDAAALPLVGDETAWLVVAQDQPFAQAERERTLGIVLGVLAGSLLLAVPLSGWLGRRWISEPLEKVRAGVHAFAMGNLETRIDYPPVDEFGALAEDFNILAIALRVREIAIKEGEENWRAMIEAIESSGIGFYIVDSHLQISYSSRNLSGMLPGIRDGAACHQAVFGNTERCEFCPLGRVIESGETVRFQTPPVKSRIFDILAMPVGEGTGKRRQLALIQDVTDRIESERGLREAATVFEATSEGIMVTDAQGIIKRVNPAFTAITGYTAEEVVGQTPRILKSGRQDQEYYKNLWRALHADGHWESEIWNRRKDGEIYPVWEIISSVKDANGEPTEFISVFMDITEKKRSEEEISFRANFDALTGLPNRGLLTERLGQALKQARREQAMLALMFVDLDFFKQVNDTLGHAIGDRLLQQVAERLRSCVREADTIARLGGDEFVVLLIDVDGTGAAAVVAEKIILQISAAFQIDRHEIHVGASVGITLYPDDGYDVETLFRNADLAMYRAKDAGRNNAQFFEPEMTATALQRRAVEADLRGALGRDEFVLHYQPVINLASGRIVGAEALLRWQHPRRGYMRPDLFIPVAEDSGMIREIGLWAFETSCRQLADWQAAGHALSLAINVSVRQLPESLSVAHIQETLARLGLQPRQIVLEITESVLLAESPHMQQWFKDAGKSGVQLAIDDFGTGYSSLSYLKRYPVHHVKIDQSFVRDMASDATDRALVEAILAMAHSLGLSVVAEGVETAEQAGLLAARACELAQGYHYSRPVGAGEFTAMLEKQAAG